MTVLDNRQRSRSRTWVLFFLSLCTTSSSMLSFMRMSKATRAGVRIWGEAGNSVWISGGYRSHGTQRQERLDNRDPQRHRSQYRQPIVASPSILHCQCFVFLFQIPTSNTQRAWNFDRQTSTWFKSLIWRWGWGSVSSLLNFYQTQVRSLLCLASPCSRWILFKLSDVTKLLDGILEVVTWICQNWYMNFSKLLHWFVKVALCTSRPLTKQNQA